MEQEIAKYQEHLPPEEDMLEPLTHPPEAFDLPSDGEAADTAAPVATESVTQTASAEKIGTREPLVLISPYAFTIEGMEATQGTQFYKSSRRLHAPHAEPDNAVPLIRRKHLAIRVYPNLRKYPWISAGPVYGDVWFKRTDISDSYKKAMPLNGPITGRVATSINRGLASHTLNFRISDLYTRGTLLIYTRCRAYISGKWRYTPWFNRSFTFTTVPSVRIRAHGVHYHRNGLHKSPPPLSDFIATGVYLRKTYPMSRFQFLSYDTITFGGDLNNTAGGGCGQGWNALWNLLRTLYFASGQDANHYALMKKGIPTAYGGCGGGNVGASFVGDGSIMAQELGHGLGRGHAPGCGAGGPDPSYPYYTHPRTATIGEYGMDYATGKIYDPANSNDFMGYCANPWVSPYTYRSLINGINNQPSPSGAPAAGGHAEDLRHQQEHLYLNFRVSCEGVVKLQSGFSIVGPATMISGKETEHSVEVRDADGGILWAKRLVLDEAHQDEDHSHTQYSDAIPMLEGAAKLVFKCGHEKGASIIELPKNAPELVLKAPKTQKGIPQSGKLNLDWVTQCGEEEKISSIIRYSNDGGSSWQPVAVGIESSEHEIDLDQLPGGEDCKLQVIASNILRSATAETDSFSVQKKPRIAMISPIQQSEEEKALQVVELAGCAYSPDGCADEAELQWFSSLDGHIGTGEHLMANNLRAGEHVISLIAPDNTGGETRAEFKVRLLKNI